MSDAFVRVLVDEAARPYKSIGRYAWHFARNKLGFDPAFSTLLEKGLIADGRVLDIGSGQGLLSAWLVAARQLFERGIWQPGWPSPPRLDAMRGIELVQRDLEWAQAALGGHAEFVQGDMCQADFGRADTVVILDVLHYVKPELQDEVLRRVRSALAPGGRLLLRIGDADGGFPFRISKLVDQLVFFARSGSFCTLHCRSLRHWKEALAALGFSVEVLPIRQDSVFASVLLSARLL